MKRTIRAVAAAATQLARNQVDLLYGLRDRAYRLRHAPPTVLSIDETLRRIVCDKCSASRFGNTEIILIAGKNEPRYQDYSPCISQKLREVLGSDEPGHLVCLSPVFGDNAALVQDSRRYWQQHLSRFRKTWYEHLLPGKDYGNTFVSRFYMTIQDKSKTGARYELWKTLWQGRDLVFVEGEKSRMGVGNDLFAGARSISRILGPATNAFSQYDRLLAAALKFSRDHLFLLALGPTATVLSLDLHRRGYHAIDIGHIDVEYEWFRRGVTRKEPLKFKYVNEAEAGDQVEDSTDSAYLSQIAARIV